MVFHILDSMKKDYEKAYETDEILGKYLDTDEESAERRRLLNDDILGKYIQETPEQGLSEEEIRRARMAAARKKALKEQEKAAGRKRRRRRLAVSITLCVVLAAGLGIWQQIRMPVGISELTEDEAEAARKALEESRKAAETPPVTDTPAPEPEPEETPEPTPTPDTTFYDPADDWCLILVNEDHPLPEDYDPEVVLIENEQYTDVRCSDALLKMLTDCRLEGLNPLVISGFRTHELQELYFTNMTEMYMAGGEDQETARKHASESVAVPGTSEHELGLAADIGTTTNPDVDESQLEEPAQQWLMENCWKYGYVVRYPTDKSEITGIIFEPWHYRYVGKTAARVMHQENLCLEEYIEKYVNKTAASSDDEAASDNAGQPESSSSVLP